MKVNAAKRIQALNPQANLHPMLAEEQNQPNQLAVVPQEELLEDKKEQLEEVHDKWNEGKEEDDSEDDSDEEEEAELEPVNDALIDNEDLLDEPVVTVGSQAEANERAKQVRMLELKRRHGYSNGRMMLTLTHKYGFSQDEAKEAIKYITRLGLTGAINPHSLEADMKPSGLSPAMFTPGTQLKAAQRLLASQGKFTARTLEAAASGTLGVEIQAALEIMARATAVSRVAEQGMKTVRDLLISKGYDIHTTQNKAFYTTQFTRLDEEGRAHSFQMMGWHGTGRFAGGEKTILEFYDDDKSKDKPVVSIGNISADNVNPAKQTEVVQHIVDYIKHNG